LFAQRDCPIVEAAEQAAAQAKTTVRAFELRRPARKPFPAHLPRERVVIEVPTVNPGPKWGHCPA
jgi:hypothetical protein